VGSRCGELKINQKGKKAQKKGEGGDLRLTKDLYIGQYPPTKAIGGRLLLAKKLKRGGEKKKLGVLAK